ncbi:MAG: hypothetical protein ACHQEM_09390 [Chitinophagales bacterium]
MLSYNVMGRWLFMLLLPVCLMFCAHPTGLSPDEQKEIAKEARQALDDYYHDIASEGLLSEFKWLDSSTSFFWLPPGYSAPINYDSVARIIRSNAAALKHIEENWEELHIQPLSREFVSYSGRLKSSATDTMSIRHETRLVETGILAKRKTGWKLLCGQTNIFSPGQENH